MQSSEDLDPLDTILRSWRSGNIDPVNKIFWSLNRDLILKFASENSSKGERILDIGCGTGEYLIKLAKEGKNGYGIDPLRETSLLKARDEMKIEGVSFPLIQAFGEKLPFKTRSFDMVLCISTLQHVRDQRATLNEIRRVLGKNGRLVVSVPQTVRKSTFKKWGSIQCISI
jgi:ubiquinone/menaquinone biosynthesis C-methylase UbiE